VEVSEARCHLPMLGARAAGSLRGDDFHETPRVAIEALLKVEDFDGPVWEPACGYGAISKVLEAHGIPVVSTDLVERGYGQGRIDFLMEMGPRAPNIITNPPFKLAAEFACKAASFSPAKVALLCRLGWLEGKSRRLMFMRTGLARVWVFSGRLPMMHRVGWAGKESTSAIAFAWFVWDRDHYGPPELGWLP